jgi:hypothetical protein
MSRANWRWNGLVVVLGMFLVSAVGCSRIGLGETWFMWGSYNVVDPHPRHEFYDATLKALWELGFVVDTEERDRDSVMMEALRGKTVVRVHLSDGPANSTRVSYHINSFGNKRLAREILAKTKAALGGAAPAPAPKKG